jgi:hypothetical protein
MHPIGGHNSVVTGPDGADRIVYHAWDDAGERRQMWIERLRGSLGLEPPAHDRHGLGALVHQ